MADRFSYSSAPQRKVKALQFGVLDADFLVRGRAPAAPASLPSALFVCCQFDWGEALEEGGLGGTPRGLPSASRREPSPPLPPPGLPTHPRPPARPRCLQRRYSVAKIDTSQTYEKGRPKLGGLSDPRMGTMDRALKVGAQGAAACACGALHASGRFVLKVLLAWL